MKLIPVLILCIMSCEAYYDVCSGTNFKNILLKCLSDSGLPFDDLGEFVTSKFAKSEKAKCFRACVFLKCQYITADGLFYRNVPKRMAHLLNGGFPQHTPLIENAANYCIHNVGRYPSVCDTTEAYVRCFIKKSPVPFLLHGVF